VIFQSQPLNYTASLHFKSYFRRNSVAQAVPRFKCTILRNNGQALTLCLEIQFVFLSQMAVETAFQVQTLFLLPPKRFSFLGQTSTCTNLVQHKQASSLIILWKAIALQVQEVL